MKSSKEQNAAYLQSRVQGFLYLLESGSLETLSQDHGDDIIKLMDTGEVKVHPLSIIIEVFMSLSLCTCVVAAVIKMEGGTDNDLLSLDQTFSSENGDKAGEGEDKGGKEKNSESKKKFVRILLPRSLEIAMLWMVLLYVVCVCREAIFHGE